MSSWKKPARILAGAGIVLVAVSALTAQGAPSSNVDQESEVDPVAEFEKDFAPVRVNASGQTYGPLRDGDEANGTVPDLILVVGNNGTEGYVERHIIIVPLDELPQSPEEALRWNEDHQEPRTYPVFESDGVTQIDTWTS